MKRISLILALGLILTGCGQNSNDQQDMEEKAMMALNQGNYSLAIDLFSSLYNKTGKENYKVYLAHSYAGCGQFKAVSFYEKVKIAEKYEAKDFEDYLFLLSSLAPKLTTDQRECLTKAGDLYFEIEENIRNLDARNNNFQWSLFNLYILMVNTKDLTPFLAYKFDPIIYQKPTLDLGEINLDSFTGVLQDGINFYFKLDKTLQNIFRLYLMLDYSYPELQKISGKLEDLLREYVNKYYGQLVVKSEKEEYKSFVEDIVEDNPEFPDFLINHISTKYPIEEISEQMLLDILFKKIKEEDVVRAL